MGSKSHSGQWKLGHVQGVEMEEGVWQWHHLRDSETEIQVVCESRQGQRHGVRGEDVGRNGVLN